MPLPTPSMGGRSGVTKIETPEDTSPEPMKWTLDEVGKALLSLQRVEPLLRELLLDAKNRGQIRENSHYVFRLDTNSAPATNGEGHKLDVSTIFGGTPAHSLSVNANGGGNLQVNINNTGWLNVGTGDYFDNETILTLSVRVTTGAAGTAILRLGARIGA